jgi:hypothetical protein
MAMGNLGGWRVLFFAGTPIDHSLLPIDQLTINAKILIYRTVKNGGCEIVFGWWGKRLGDRGVKNLEQLLPHPIFAPHSMRM